MLGWDVAGEVVAVGDEVREFRPGDRVFYAGAIDRAGGNSELHVVDERIVGRMPGALDFARAAALPLTAITAWELLFERLGVREGKGDDRQSLLVIGAAGGVGSILVQLARQLTGLTVIGTASRAETQAWVQTGCRTAGIGCLDCKKPLIDRIVAEITVMRQRAQEFEENPDLVRGIIAEGCEKARSVASETLDDVNQAMGLAYR